MNFEQIKNECVPDETILCWSYDEFKYVGFNAGLMITSNKENTLQSWGEDQIKDWEIKKPKRTVTMYSYLYALHGVEKGITNPSSIRWKDEKSYLKEFITEVEY